MVNCKVNGHIIIWVFFFSKGRSIADITVKDLLF